MHTKNKPRMCSEGMVTTYDVRPRPALPPFARTTSAVAMWHGRHRLANRRGDPRDGPLPAANPDARPAANPDARPAACRHAAPVCDPLVVTAAAGAADAPGEGSRPHHRPYDRRAEGVSIRQVSSRVGDRDARGAGAVCWRPHRAVRRDADR